MAIQIVRNRDIFKSNTEAIVNPVNTHGIMGAGLALQFKREFPEMFHYYQKEASKNKIKLGEVTLYQLPDKKGNLAYIILFPTKLRWTFNSNLKDIVNGMRSLRVLVNHYQIKSLAIPALGCGLGGLKWEVVLPVIVQECRNMENCNMTIIEPEIK